MRPHHGPHHGRFPGQASGGRSIGVAVFMGVGLGLLAAIWHVQSNSSAVSASPHCTCASTQGVSLPLALPSHRNLALPEKLLRGVRACASSTALFFPLSLALPSPHPAFASHQVVATHSELCRFLEVR